MTQRMAQFSRVSYEQFKSDWLEAFPSLADMSSEEVEEHVRDIYDNIQLPKRSTAQSAGYDFFSPMSFTLEPGESILIPTGIRCEMYDGWVLLAFPRSGQGFKYGIHHANSIPVIDGDYFEADNEGNIKFKMVNDSSLAKTIHIGKGGRFCQGVFLQYGITLDDKATGERTGGMGSTGN